MSTQQARTQSVYSACAAAVLGVAIIWLWLSADEVDAEIIAITLGLAVSMVFFSWTAFWAARQRGALVRANESIDRAQVVAESIVWKRERPGQASSPALAYVTETELVLIPQGRSRDAKRFRLDHLRSATFSAGMRNARLELQFDNEHFELRSVKSDLKPLHVAIGKPQH